MHQPGRTVKGLLLFIASMLQTQSAGGQHRISQEVLNLHQLVAPKTRPPPCLIRNRSPFKIESYSFPPIPPAREKQQSLYSSKRLVRSGPWQATPSQGLGPGPRPPVMRTRATHTVRCANRPGRPRDETRFKQHPPSLRAQEKMEIRVYGRGHSTPQVQWFCARSFETAVGSRLKDPEASEGLV